MTVFLVRAPYYAAAVVQVTLFLFTDVASDQRLYFVLMTLMILHGEVVLVNTALLPGFHGYNVVNLTKCLHLHCAVVAGILMAGQAVSKMLVSRQLPDRIEGLADQMSHWITSRKHVHTLFPSLPPQDDVDMLVPEQEQSNDAEDRVQAGAQQEKSRIQSQKEALLVVVVDRILLLFYLLFLLLFRI